MSSTEAFQHGRKVYRHMHSRGLTVDDSIARAVAHEAWRQPADRAAFVAGWTAERATDAADRRSHARKHGPPSPFIPLPGFDD